MDTMWDVRELPRPKFDSYDIWEPINRFIERRPSSSTSSKTSWKTPTILFRSHYPRYVILDVCKAGGLPDKFNIFSKECLQVFEILQDFSFTLYLLFEFFFVYETSQFIERKSPKIIKQMLQWSSFIFNAKNLYWISFEINTLKSQKYLFGMLN